MFSSYDNISAEYVPDNTTKVLPGDYVIKSDSYPAMIHDIKDRFLGFTWNYGDSVDLNLTVNDKVKVNKDSLIYLESGQFPATGVPGYKGQQAYNVVDYKSWTCIGEVDGITVWVEDEDVIYDSQGTKEIEFIKDMTDKGVEVRLYNFRWEIMKTFESFGENKVTCQFTSDLYKDLKSGIYYCTVYITGGDTDVFHRKFIISIT